MTENNAIVVARKFGIELPENMVDYPEVLCRWFADLGKRTEEQKLKRLDIPKNLSLIAEGVFLLGLQSAYENEMKTKALGVIMRDRLLRARKENQWLNGNSLIQATSIRKL